MNPLTVETAPLDWGYDELVREGLSLIPAYAPQWTNHNASDPGITLLELLASFSEILAYRALRITPDAQLNFLRLLDGGRNAASDALHGAPAAAVEQAIRSRVQAMAHARCAVTPADFERLAIDTAAELLGEDRGSVRALCVPGVDLRHAPAAGSPAAAVPAPGDVSLVISPGRELPPAELETLCRQVELALAPRCLLTTRARVIGPVVLRVFIGCALALAPGVSLDEASAAIDAALARRFDPQTEPFGKALQMAELAAVIDATPGVDYVEDIIVWRIASPSSADEGEGRVGVRVGLIATPGEDARFGGLASVGGQRLVRDDAGEVEFLRLHPWELLQVRLAPGRVHELATAIGDGRGR